MQVGNTHNIVINEETGFAYLVGSTRSGSGITVCSGGLHIVDIKEPLNPQFSTCYGGDGEYSYLQTVLRIYVGVAAHNKEAVCKPVLHSSLATLSNNGDRNSQCACVCVCVCVYVRACVLACMSVCVSVLSSGWASGSPEPPPPKNFNFGPSQYTALFDFVMAMLRSHDTMFATYL